MWPLPGGVQDGCDQPAGRCGRRCQLGCRGGSTGIPPAMLAARRSIRRSPPLQGRLPASRAAMAAGQSIWAILVVPSVMLTPVRTNAPAKSSRCSQMLWPMSRPTPASAGRRRWRRRAARRAVDGHWQSSGPLAGGNGGRVVTVRPAVSAKPGMPRFMAALRRALIWSIWVSLSRGAGEADLQPLGLAEPAWPLGLGDAGGQVAADLGRAVALCGVGPQQRAPQAGVFVDAWGVRRSARSRRERPCGSRSGRGTRPIPPRSGCGTPRPGAAHGGGR